MNKRENQRYEKRITKTVDHLRAAGISIYRDESSNPLWNAHTREAMRKTAARQIRDAKTLLRGAR